MANKNSFVLRNSYADIFNDLSDKQAGVLIKVIFNYVTAKDTEASLPDVELKMAWKFIKQDIDYDTHKYKNLCEQRAEWGKQGGRPKAQDLQESIRFSEKHKVSEKAQGFSEKHIDSDVVVDVVSDSELDNKLSNKEKVKRESFKKPTLDEVVAYCEERNNTVSAQAFVDYYTSKGWKIGSTPMKDWKAAVRTWERRDNGGNNHGTDYNRNPEPNKYAGFGRKIEELGE